MDRALGGRLSHTARSAEPRIGADPEAGARDVVYAAKPLLTPILDNRELHQGILPFDRAGRDRDSVLGVVMHYLRTGDQRPAPQLAREMITAMPQWMYPAATLTAW